MKRLVSLFVLVVAGCDEPSAPPRSPSHEPAPPQRPIDDGPVADTRPAHEDPSRALAEMQALRAAASRWSPDNPDQCPTGEQLRATKGLEQAITTLDPWGRAYKIICEDTNVTVTSAGPDRREGTADDLHVP